MATGDVGTSVDAAEPAVVRSNWWYVVGFVAAWSLATTVVFGLYLLSFRQLGAVVAPLAYLSVVVLLSLPIALDLDLGAIDRSGIDWSPNRTLYVVAGVVGGVLAVLSFVVAVVYLYRRHEHVGTP